MIDNKYAVGIVGCGGMGGGHAIAIASGTGNAVWNDDSNEGTPWEGNMNSDISQKLTLAGVYDIDPARQKWAADRGFRNYDSFNRPNSSMTVLPEILNPPSKSLSTTVALNGETKLSNILDPAVTCLPFCIILSSNATVSAPDTL
jgi:hypothetical protein